MKRFLSVFLTLAMLTTLLSGMAIFAAPVAMEVIADEGWENATYDEETGILTNVDGGYSFTVDGSTIGPVIDQVITAEKVVIPSGIVTGGGTLSIKNVNTNIFGTTNEAIKDIVVSEGITTLNKNAFQNTKAAVTIDLPSTLTTINEYAFNSSTATSIVLPDSVKTIKKGAFQYCKGITEITIPDAVTVFGGNEVFRGCSGLTKINLSSTMTDTNSGGGAFRDCSALASITLPAKLAQLRKNDFYNCKALKEVIFTQPVAPTVNSAAFSKCTGMTVTLPGEGEGYTAEWKALLPADTTFKYTRGNPKADSALLDGLNLIGATLTASYTYFDPEDRAESGSTILWEASTMADFSAEVTEIKTEACVSGTPSTYVLTEAENGKFVRATIIVRNTGEDLNEGKPVVLNLAEAVRVPVTKPAVAITNYKNDEEVAINKEIEITATATCDNTTITKVEFFAGEALIGEATAEPYSVKWTPATEGAVELSAIAYNALGESTASEKLAINVVGRIPIFSIKTSGPDWWGGFNGTNATKTEGAAEDGVGTAWVLTGGKSGGGGTFSLNVGGFAAATNKHYDKNGNQIGSTKGLIDASEFVIRYKSTNSFKVRFRLEYRASKSPTKTSASVSLPSTGGEWSTAKIPMSEFAPGDTLEDQWVHQICGAYTSNFEPVVMFRVESLNLGDSGQFVLDHFGANWYEDEMVTKVEWAEEPTKSYFQYYDDFDYTTGKLNIYRGNATEPTEVYSLDDPRVKVSGYNNTKIYNNSNDSKNLKITVTTWGKTLTYYVRILPFVPETLTEIKVNEPKTEYYVGDPFDYETGLIQATYSDKDPEFAQLDDKNAAIEGFDTTTEGEKTVTVTYGGKSTTYTINVKTYTVEGVTSITVNNPRRVYSVGDSFNYHDGDITPYNGTSALTKLDLYNRYVQITGFDSSAPAEDQIITVNYSGISTTYTVDILADDVPVAYYNELDMTEGNRPSVWYPTSGTSFVDGAGVDGVKSAMKFGTRATYQCALTGGWGGGNSTTNIGTTVNGLKGADAISITYKSDSESSIQFRMDYRASDKATLSSASPTFPSTGGIWKTVVIPMSDFEPTATGESFDQQKESVDWVYTNIAGGYTTNFEPVIIMYVKAGNGDDQPTYIDNIKGIWYDNYKTVKSISVTPAKTNYYDGQDLDLLGEAVITYDDDTTKTGTMEDFDITYTGFDNTTPGVQTITASYGGKSTTFDVTVLEGGNEISSVGLSDDAKTAYLIGAESFDTSVGSIVITRVNGEVENIPLSGSKVKVEGFDSSAQNTNLDVTITYEDLVLPVKVRVYKPVMLYSNAEFVDADNNTISSFGSYDTVYATVKATNRIPCESPLTANVFAVAYYNNTTKIVKAAEKINIAASSAEVISIPFTAEELEGANKIKIMVLDDNLDNELKATVSISK